MAAEREKMSAEEYFLRYAFPCIGNLTQKNRLSKGDAENLEKIVFEKKTIQKDYLESCFPEAFRRIKEVAGQMKKPYWNVSVIKKYWEEEHNRFIDSGDGEYSKATNSFKELCKVHKAEVIAKKDNVLTVKYGEITRNVFATLAPDAKKGDRVTVHLAFAIEKIS
jgi:hypothetical protein